MPNIQYWIGEVHYAQQNFEKAIIAFGEGLKNYPESIKGPDNLLKLGLSFSNLKKKKMKHVMFCMSLESNMKMHQKMFLNAPPQKLKN